jgi:hypothetical protein
MHLSSKDTFAAQAYRVILLVILNLLLISITGFLTLAVEANDHSRIGALLLSFFIPVFIVIKTSKVSGLERLMKFGVGYAGYILLGLIYAGIIIMVTTTLLPCLLISMAVLYFGNDIIKYLNIPTSAR